MPKPLHITCNRERANLLSQTFSGARNVMFAPTTKGVKTKVYKKHHCLSSTQIVETIFLASVKKREREGGGWGVGRKGRVENDEAETVTVATAERTDWRDKPAE